MVNKSLMVAVGVPEANPTFISGRGTRHAYISGANKTRQKIGMTTPVEIAKPSIKILMTTPVEINTTNDAGVMRFFIPSNYSKNDLTDPSDPRVRAPADCDHRFQLIATRRSD